MTLIALASGRSPGLTTTVALPVAERAAVSVTVTDCGEGIPIDDLPKVFTKFFRRAEGRPTGSGLGLWISRGLVEAHTSSSVAERNASMSSPTGKPL